MSGLEGPLYRVSEYTMYPSGFDRVATTGKYDWCLTIADAGDGWAIRWRSRCVNYAGDLEFEPPVQSRTPAFLRRCRFTEHAALHRARRVIDELVVDGRTFDEFVEQVRTEATTKAREALRRSRRRSATRLVGI